MKHAIVLLLGLAFVLQPLRAEEKNGLRVSVQKTTVDREQSRTSLDWSRVAKELALKVAVKNTTFKDMPEGSVDYTIIVRRWGYMPELYERHSGSEHLPALKTGEETTIVTGNVKTGGYETFTNRKQYQDSIEAWQVVVKQNGAEVLKLTSSASFDKLNARAKDRAK